MLAMEFAMDTLQENAFSFDGERCAIMFYQLQPLFICDNPERIVISDKAKEEGWHYENGEFIAKVNGYTENLEVCNFADMMSLE